MSSVDVLEEWMRRQNILVDKHTFHADHVDQAFMATHLACVNDNSGAGDIVQDDGGLARGEAS